MFWCEDIHRLAGFCELGSLMNQAFGLLKTSRVRKNMCFHSNRCMLSEVPFECWCVLKITIRKDVIQWLMLEKEMFPKHKYRTVGLRSIHQDYHLGSFDSVFFCWSTSPETTTKSKVPDVSTRKSSTHHLVVWYIARYYIGLTSLILWHSMRFLCHLGRCCFGHVQVPKTWMAALGVSSPLWRKPSGLGNPDLAVLGELGKESLQPPRIKMYIIVCVIITTQNNYWRLCRSQGTYSFLTVFQPKGKHIVHSQHFEKFLKRLKPSYASPR